MKVPAGPTDSKPAWGPVGGGGSSAALVLSGVSCRAGRTALHWGRTAAGSQACEGASTELWLGEAQLILRGIWSPDGTSASPPTEGPVDFRQPLGGATSNESVSCRELPHSSISSH